MTRTWTIDVCHSIDHGYWDNPDAESGKNFKLYFFGIILDEVMPWWRAKSFYSIIERGGA
jgi:hypothetical protein